MSWRKGLHCKSSSELLSANDLILEKYKGELGTHDAQVSLAKFLAHNPTAAAMMLMGIDLYPFQDLLIRAMWQRDYFLAIAGRGLSKTFTCGIFAALYAIFNPGVRIGITSKTFRQARAIYKTIEDLAHSPKGKFLLQCIKSNSHNQEAWEMKLGYEKDSLIVALPLGAAGEKIRGYRFNVMLIDEMLLLSDEVINTVIRPFLNVKIDPRDQEKIKKKEDLLIKQGVMKESERYKFPRAKLIGLSSATYQFEYLYDLYSNYIDRIFSKKDKSVSHSIFQLSYEVGLKHQMYEETVIEEAKKQLSEQQFAREYRAQFTSDSGGYFSAQKMLACTLDSDDDQHIRLTGEKGKEYLLAIDPNYSDSEAADNFAMIVLELDVENKRSTVVHSYALSKSNLNNRALYLRYLLTHFNIVYIIVDNAGGFKFINDMNDHTTIKEAGIQMKFFEQKLEVDEGYDQAIEEAKLSFDSVARNKVIPVHSQVFNKTQWIRRANEELQSAFDHKRVLFSNSLPSERIYNKLKKERIPISALEYSQELQDLPNSGARLIDFIDHQQNMIDQIKVECALIEVRASPTGGQTFDLPQNLRKDKSPTRARKDSYTALFLGNWGAKCYFDIRNAKTQKKENSFFKPFFAT